MTAQLNIWSQLIIILKRTGWILLLLSVATALVEQYLTHSMERELSSMSGASPYVWVYGAASILMSILSPIVASLLILAALLPASVITSLKRHAEFLCKETFRAAGKSMGWGILLIIPGIIRFLQFSFVPYIVMLDPDYREGRKDALKESTLLVNRRFAWVLGIIFLFGIILPFLTTFFDEYALFEDHPFYAILLAGLDGLLTIISILMLLKQWEKSHGTHVQLETN